MAELTHWQDWEVVNMIGRGSYGAVYEIRRTIFDETEKAALKVLSIPQNEMEIKALRSEGYDDESITAVFEDQLQGILKEYMLMRKLNGNTNVVNCDDVQRIHHDDGLGWDIYIKMELLQPMSDSLPRVPSDAQVIKVGIDMCNALMLCNRFDIIHRDIKPQNIFVSIHGDYKLGDFGVARTMERTTMGTKTGTYNYMAPEVYNNRAYNHTVDIYSLGIVLYWLLNERRTPFLPLPPIIAKAADQDRARYLRFRGDRLPSPKYGSDALQAVVLKACAFDPKDRYQSAAEMKKALEELSVLREKTEAEVCEDETVSVQRQTAEKKTVAELSRTAEEKTVVECPAPISVESEPESPKSEPLKTDEKAESPKTEKQSASHKPKRSARKETAAAPKRKGKGLLAGLVLLILIIAAVAVAGRDKGADLTADVTNVPQATVTPTAVPAGTPTPVPTLTPAPMQDLDFENSYFQMTMMSSVGDERTDDNFVESHNNRVVIIMTEFFRNHCGKIVEYHLLDPKRNECPAEWIQVTFSENEVVVQPTAQLPYGSYEVELNCTKDSFSFTVVYGIYGVRYSMGKVFRDVSFWFDQATHEQTGVPFTEELLAQYDAKNEEEPGYDMYLERTKDGKANYVLFIDGDGYIAYGNGGLYYSDALTDACWWNME